MSYHNVVAGPLDAYDRRLSRLTAAELARQMDFLLRRLRPLPLPELLRRLDAGRPDPRAVAVTFDDGYLGVVEHALPILSERDIPATVFVVTDHLENDDLFHFDEIELAFRLTRKRFLRLELLGRTPWPIFTRYGRRWCLKRFKKRLKLLPEDERLRHHRRALATLDVSPQRCREEAAGIEKYRSLKVADVKRLLAAGWTVGSHTRSHRTLSRLCQRELESEVVGSLRDLELRFGLEEVPFAYPYGQPEHIGRQAAAAAARAGYSCAVTTVAGPNTTDVDRFAMRRMEFHELREVTP